MKNLMINDTQYYTCSYNRFDIGLTISSLPFPVPHYRGDCENLFPHLQLLAVQSFDYQNALSLYSLLNHFPGTVFADAHIYNHTCGVEDIMQLIYMHALIEPFPLLQIMTSLGGKTSKKAF